jgi:hypothetical protein
MGSEKETTRCAMVIVLLFVEVHALDVDFSRVNFSAGSFSTDYERWSHIMQELLLAKSESKYPAKKGTAI